MKIAVDVMSGERSPEPLVHGALESLKEHNASIILVGDKDIITSALKKYPHDKSRIEIVHSTQIIKMHESPTEAIKQKPDASVMVATQLVKNGLADGFISPGNTGATVATAFWKLGRLKGVSRPAILAKLPTSSYKYTAILDVGAIPECKAIHLVQFAVMGAVHVSKLYDIKSPRIGLLCNGEEETKGTAVSRKAYKILKKLPVNFVGNIEGRNLFDGSIDVAVCDGFTGNIILKATEGVGLTIYSLLKTEIRKSIIFQASALLMVKVFKELKKKIDYQEYGGAQLIGVNGVCIKTHGSSSTKDIKNGIKVAVKAVQNEMNGEIIEKLKEYGVNKLNWHFWGEDPEDL
ncbi:MAG: phosphate acyltransferase PlsX [bacterium]|nr:phosphate acyltransferase PlsX [bacterium]